MRHFVFIITTVLIYSMCNIHTLGNNPEDMDSLKNERFRLNNIQLDQNGKPDKETNDYDVRNFFNARNKTSSGYKELNQYIDILDELYDYTETQLKKANESIVRLNQQLNDTTKVLNIIKRESSKLNPLLSDNNDVFNMDLPDELEVPASLKERYNSMQIIKEAFDKMNLIDIKIAKAQSYARDNNFTEKDEIYRAIDEPLTDLYNILSKLFSKDSNLLLPFSDKQRQYLTKELKDKYNQYNNQYN